MTQITSSVISDSLLFRCSTAHREAAKPAAGSRILPMEGMGNLEALGIPAVPEVIEGALVIPEAVSLPMVNVPMSV